VIRLAGALLIEQNDAWLVQRRYLSVARSRSLEAAVEVLVPARKQVPTPVRPALLLGR
jgi:hypothetical protein